MMTEFFFLGITYPFKQTLLRYSLDVFRKLKNIDIVYFQDTSGGFRNENKVNVSACTRTGQQRIPWDRGKQHCADNCVCWTTAGAAWKWLPEQPVPTPASLLYSRRSGLFWHGRQQQILSSFLKPEQDVCFWCESMYSRKRTKDCSDGYCVCVWRLKTQSYRTERRRGFAQTFSKLIGRVSAPAVKQSWRSQ